MDSGIPVELVGSFGELYPGYIVGFRAPDSFKFRFVGEDSPGLPAEINASPCRLRKPPRGNVHTISASIVSVGLEVEVLAGKPVNDDGFNHLFYQTGELPPSWWPAHVVKQRGDFVVVEFDIRESHEHPPVFPQPLLDGVAENNQIRPKSSQKQLTESDFFYHVLDIPKELVGLFIDPSNVQHIVRACGQPMLICQVSTYMNLPKELGNVDLSDESKSKFLITCTSPETITKAKTLGHDVIRMLRQKYSILNQINEISRRIKGTQPCKASFPFICVITSKLFDSLICEEFSVEPDLVGQSIGASGANIRQARKVDGVVSVVLNPDTCTFRVSGKTREAVENARKMLEYATEVMQVPRQYVARIIGQKNRQIQALVDLVGLAKIRVQAADEATVPNCVPFAFTGTRSAINDAKLLINFNIENLKEIDQLQASVAPHGRNGGGHQHKKRDASSKSTSDCIKGERRFRVQQTDNGQATDSGMTTATTFNGDTAKGSRGGRTTDTAAEQSDPPPHRHPPRPSNPPRKNKQQARVAAVVGGAVLPSFPGQNSLPPPAPKPGM
ncbi:unnamed protein product [Mesocestoides corti]|uniref:K Homology domain-containing protein n=1 Tax=Mesocestoides corti TaxID=53468 RepID=A0A0R3U4Z1_MESCO|nr:unnamed protein product [Mesocestoides corti]